MAPVTQRRFANLDDEDVLDDFDPAYFPKRVYKDGRGPRVRLMLTDSAPRSLTDAARHRPHQVGVGLGDSAELRAARRMADEAYDAYVRELSDAWRGPSAPPPLVVKDGESARDAYIRELGEAWRTPPRGNGVGAEANANQAAVNRMISPGARPGDDGRRQPTTDAAADRDAAYQEYLDRLENGWQT